ncbi:arginine--tRNA ligase [Spirosoma foliorum]|uniref:Arginine--tRNA ligase n=1 Tax=Spirosoma foliorum TaxID=2710596 RepID=A0A7G5GQZ8_9BACT|nr:arginine--tRNA ligase [Spirosoma foliorum]QMW01290.1 arginine--tRNA ligase [Spirosoma foliorum]
MDIQSIVAADIARSIAELYSGNACDVQLSPTKKEFEGQYTFVTFPLTKALRQAPAQIGQTIGAWLLENSSVVSAFNVVQGFLNISIADAAWVGLLNDIAANPSFGTLPSKEQSVMVEFSSPNTNKPLHLGHLRNNFLGDSVSKILAANGYDVVKTCIVNDRGVHICKSMLAYRMFGNGETPESASMKGDHLIGKYYVRFDRELKEQLKPILDSIYTKRDLSLFSETQQTQLKIHLQNLEGLEVRLSQEVQQLAFDEIAALGFNTEISLESAIDGKIKWKDVLKSIDDADVKIKERKQKELQKILKSVLAIEEEIDGEKDEVKDIAQTKAPLMLEVQQMLRLWEQGDPETVALWSQLNAWVYTGFDATYKRIGVSFDKTYYESNTYLLGKEIVEEGIQKGVFFRKDDSSVWIDLTAEGLDQKLVMRSDGTSVYMTQDLGTTDLKFQDFQNDRQIWVVGNEQDYHFNVLFAILRKLGRTYADGLYHLSYGMVDLPTGKMKSREGTVVDADDLIKETIDAASTAADEAAKGKLEDFSQEEKDALFQTLGLGALKYYLLKVDPQKRMQFNPAESVDLHGNTGPYIQYVHARIRSILRKAAELTMTLEGPVSATQLDELEQQLVFLLSQYTQRVAEAGTDYAPSYIAQYAYELAKTFNQFYDKLSILKETDPIKLHTRLVLSKTVSETIRKSMGLLGIEVPEKM